jgi:membrane protein YdbS with pleckstrin-like domain
MAAININNTNSGGIGFVGLLTIVFITLKLLGVITWSWWWVLSPIWISVGLAIGILLLVAITVFLIALIKSKNTKITLKTRNTHDNKSKKQIRRGNV